MPTFSATELERTLALSLDANGDLCGGSGEFHVAPDFPGLVVVANTGRLAGCAKRLPSYIIRTRPSLEQDRCVETVARQLTRRHDVVVVFTLEAMDDPGVRLLASENVTALSAWRSRLAALFPGASIQDTRSSVTEPAQGYLTIRTWIERDSLKDRGTCRRLIAAVKETVAHVCGSEPVVATDRLDRVSARTRELDCELAGIAAVIESLALAVPVNAMEQEQRFFESRGLHEPVFEQARPGVDLDRLHQRLQRLPLHESEGRLGQLLVARRHELALELRRRMHGDDTGFARATAVARFGAPLPSTVARATRILAQGGRAADSRQMPAGAAKKRIAAQGRRLGNLAGQPFPVGCHTVRGLAAKARVAGSCLLLRRGRRFSELEVRALGVGTVGGSMLRTANGARQPFAIFAHGLPGSSPVARGFAAFLEERAGILSSDRLVRMAARVVVAHRMANDESFTDTHAMLSGDYAMAPRDAYLACQDVYQSGGSTEPALAFEGLIALRDADLRDCDVDVLMAGNIGLEHIEMVRAGIEAGVLHRGVYRPV